MRKAVKIGAESVDLLCNAVTPILYKHVFQGDILRDLMACRKITTEDPILDDSVVEMMTQEQKEAYLKKLTDHEEKQLQLFSEMTDAVSKLAFVMAKQAEYADRGEAIRLTGLGEDDYWGWMGQFGAFDLVRATKEIIGVYNADMKTSSKRKN